VTLSFSDGTTQTIVAPIKKVMAGMSHHKHWYHYKTF
jgi:copper(I)-binding protein